MARQSSSAMRTALDRRPLIWTGSWERAALSISRYSFARAWLVVSVVMHQAYVLSYGSSRLRNSGLLVARGFLVAAVARRVERVGDAVGRAFQPLHRGLDLGQVLGADDGFEALEVG